MKIADYGKAITSYIESPTTAQKLQAKEKAQTLGRTLLADGSEDIVEPSKSMQVDTTTKGLDLFTIDDFKKKAEIYVGAYHNNALPTADIKSALNKFTQKGIDDGTFSADDAIKIVQDLKFQFQDRAQKQRLRDNIISGTGTIKPEEMADGGRIGFSEGLSEALLRRVNNYKGVVWVPKKKEFKVRNYSREADTKDTRFKVSDYPSAKAAFEAAKDFHYDTVLSPDAKKARISKASEEAAVKKNAYTQEINNWTENWFKTNTKNYTISQADKAMKDLIKDYKNSELYKRPNPGKPSTLKPGGNVYPNIGRLSSNTSVDANALRMNDVPPLTGIGKAANPENFFKSLFYSQKLVDNPNLKKLTSEYLDFVIEDKKYISRGEKEKRYGKLLNNPKLNEVKFLLNENGLKGAGQNKLFVSQFPQYKAYINKTAKSNYAMSIKKIEDTLGSKVLKEIMGTDSIIKFMKNERDALKKIFDSTPLTKGKIAQSSLGYSTEHILGIADISRMKNKNEMAKALKVITGMTSKRNAELGRKGFNNLRKYLINQIDKGIDQKENLKSLNKLIADNTDIKGDAGKIVNGKFKYNESVFKQTKNQKQRFFDYFKELFNIKEGRAEILKQAKNNPELAKIVSQLKQNKAGMYSFPAQLEMVEVPTSVSKALNVAGKIVKAAGKASGLVEPVFAVYNFSEAVDKGASLGQSTGYVVNKFFEDVVNMPALVYGGGKYVKDKFSGEDAKFELPYEATFARDKLQKTIDQTDPEIIKARLAKRDFDTQVRPNLTMVDDVDIPASKEEIDKAKDVFMKEKDVDLSVLDKPKKSTFGKYNEQIKDLVF